MRWCWLLLLATFASAEDWPRFRGPEGGGVSGSTGLPVELGPGKNLLWRVDVPMGRSSPIVVKDRLYLTALEGDTLVTLALDAKTGAASWRREIPRARSARIYAGNSTATPTAASDGENLYVFFPDLGLVSFDAAGAERWRLALGPFDSFYGISSSPVVHERTLALVCDQPSGAFVLAVDKDTGRVRWRTERKQATTEGYSTPAVYVPPGGRPQLVVSGTYRVDGYDLESGENLWWIGRQGIYPIGSPVLFGDMVIAVSEGGDTPAYPAFDAMLKELDTNKDEWLSPEEWSHHEFKDHFGWLDADKDARITRAEWEARAERERFGARRHRKPDRRPGRLHRVELRLALQEGVLAAGHAARLPGCPLPGEGRRHRDDARPADRRGAQGRTDGRRDRRVLRLAGGGGRQGLPAEPLRQADGAEGGSAVGGARLERPRRGVPGHSRDRRRPNLRPHPKGALRLRSAAPLAPQRGRGVAIGEAHALREGPVEAASAHEEAARRRRVCA